MKLSREYIKSIKGDTPEFDSRSHELLVKAGFIDQVASGIYTFLPPGLKVLTKIENIVRTQMNKLGAVEMLLPSLHPKTFWEKTGRWSSVDVLFKVSSRHDKEYALGASHEEIATPLADKYIESYKDLPLSFYQIATKYRDEERPKSGILRGREFRMKDMYSFHATHDDLKEFYQKVLQAYLSIYHEMGLESVRVTEALGGMFTQNMSHEFSVPTSAGEDELVYCTECDFTQNVEVVKKEHKECPKCKAEVKITKAIEVGNIFDLGYKYAEKFDLKYVDETDKKNLVHMGCYGIGTSRLIGAIVEIHNDEKGIVWPESVCPFQVHLSNLSPSKRAFADLLYRSLQTEGIDVLYDDRDNVTPGEKFAVADLIGVPVRLVTSERAKDTVEIKLRDSDKMRHLSPSEIINHLKDYFVK